MKFVRSIRLAAMVGVLSLAAVACTTPGTTPSPTPSGSAAPAAKSLFVQADTVINANSSGYYKTVWYNPNDPTDFGSAATATRTASKSGQVFAAINCNQVNRFGQGYRVVIRAKIFDPVTGAEMGTESISANTGTVYAKITAPAALASDSIPLKYGKHATDFLWVGGWTIPTNAPLGTVSIEIHGTDLQGRAGVWNQFGVTGAQLTVVASTDPWLPTRGQ